MATANKSFLQDAVFGFIVSWFDVIKTRIYKYSTDSVLRNPVAWDEKALIRGTMEKPLRKTNAKIG